MFFWEEELNEILDRIKKSRQRVEKLRELALSGRISRRTYDSLLPQFQRELGEADNRRKDLLSRLTVMQKELIEQARILEKLNYDLEMKVAYSQVPEDHYVKVSTALKYGIDETNRELEGISLAIKQLSEEAPAPSMYSLDRAIKRLEEKKGT